MDENNFLKDLDVNVPIEIMKKKISKIGDMFGFDEFVFAIWLSNWWNDSTPYTIVSNDYLLKDFIKYISLMAHDSFVAKIMKTSNPILWDSEYNPHHSPLIAKFSEIGFNQAYAIGAKNINNLRSIICFLKYKKENCETGIVNKDNLLKIYYNIHSYLGKFFIQKRLSTLRVNLSERECEILRWIGDGKTSEEISSILTISKNTVNFHVKNASRKLCCSNKTATVVKAINLGLL